MQADHLYIHAGHLVLHELGHVLAAPDFNSDDKSGLKAEKPAIMNIHWEARTVQDTDVQQLIAIYRLHTAHKKPCSERITMSITTVIAAVALLLCVLAACSREPGDAPVPGSQQAQGIQQQAALALESPRVEESEQQPAPAPVLGSQQAQQPAAATIGAPIAYFGVRSLEERIVVRDTVVVATLSTTTAEAITPSGGYWPGGHSIGVFFHLEVSEYLMGSGPTSIIALYVTGTSDNGDLYNTVAAAEADTSKVLSELDTTWNEREAVFFLDSDSDYVNGMVDHVIDGGGKFFMAYGISGIDPDDGYVYDGYSLHDRTEPLWLPSANTGATGDDREFLLAVPQQGVEDETITLRELKRVIASVSARLSEGDGSDEHRMCLFRVYQGENDNEYRKSTGQVDEDYHPVRPNSEDLFMESSQPAGTEVYMFNMGGYASTTTEDSSRTLVWLSGSGADLFVVKNSPLRPYPGSDIGHVFDISVVSARPLPAGTYTFTQHYAPEHLILCNHVYEHEIEVSVSMQGDSTHEFFFDPVTDGSAIFADASNGVLKPTSFTGVSGISADITRVSWESGVVKIEIFTVGSDRGPNFAISRRIVDFIELDGSVSLSLDVSDAAVDAANDTLSWAVPSQPWEDGDRLMARIREPRR